MTDPIADWEANSVRFTLFPAAHAPLTLDVWREVFGSESEPEAEETRPRENLKRQTGSYRDGQLEIVVTPIRIDIVLSPRAAEVQSFSPFPEMVYSSGVFSQELRAAATLIREWLPLCSLSMQRLAISGTAVMAATSIENTYKILSHFIKSVSIDTKNMRELHYRVNWQAKRNTSDIEYYNRITTWSAFSIAMHGSVVPTLQATPSQTFALEPRHFASLELDISTPVERASPLVPEDRVAIFDDLVYLALENLEHGECPTAP